MYIDNVPLKNSYTVEIIIPTGSTSQQFPFPDIPYLRDKYIVGVCASMNGRGVTSGKNNQNVNFGNVSYTSFLTLVDNRGKNFIQNMPIGELIAVGAISIQTVTIGNQFYSPRSTNGILSFYRRLVNFTKSYIYFPAATAFANSCFQFNVFYLTKEEVIKFKL